MTTAFAEILSNLVEQIPGAIGAVFLDWEGEAVDHFAHIPIMDILLAGAHWGIILRIVQDFLGKHSWGSPKVIILNGAEADILIKPITEEYCVVLATESGAHLATALSALDWAAEAIGEEM